MTVSRNSPSTNIRVPSTSRPSPTKNAVAVSRSATVMPTWSKRRACDMGHPSNTHLVDPLSRDVADGVVSTSITRISRRIAPASSVPPLLTRLGSADPEASCSSHRATDEASHLHDVRPRTGALRLFGWLWFRRTHPSPQPVPNLRDRLARPRVPLADRLTGRLSRSSHSTRSQGRCPRWNPQHCPSGADVASRMLNGEAVGAVLTSVRPARWRRS
jgi:hypothetical protein